MQSRRKFLTSSAALAAFGWARPARAQSWPQRPVRIIVPFPPGGNSDAIARIIAAHLGEAFGQQFVVESRAGAGGAIGAESVARAAPDGYMLFLGSPSQIAILPNVSKTAYDQVKDFSPISVIGTNPLVMVANPKLPVKTVSKLVDYARAQPTSLTYATAGVGSIAHLTAVLFLDRAGLQMTPVTYKGGAPAMTDVIAGHVPIYFPNLSEALAQASGGTLRLLAVTSDTRVPQLPDVPTLSESGFPGFKVFTWNGLMAPAGTPPDIVTKIADEVARAVKDPKIAERLAGMGVAPLGNRPEQFAALIAADNQMWSTAIKLAGIQEK